MKLSEIQFLGYKTTAAKICRVYTIKAFERWLSTPKYGVYGYTSKPYSWAFKSRNNVMSAIFKRLGK